MDCGRFDGRGEMERLRERGKKKKGIRENEEKKERERRLSIEKGISNLEGRYILDFQKNWIEILFFARNVASQFYIRNIGIP